MDAAAILHTVIPLAGMVIGGIAVLLPALIVFIVLYYRHQRSALLMATVRHLAEQGQPVPKELLDPPTRPMPWPSTTPLFRAITLIGVGVGLAVMFYLMGLRFLTGIGAMLVCIGAAQLLALAIERKSADKG